MSDYIELIEFCVIFAGLGIIAILYFVFKETVEGDKGEDE